MGATNQISWDGAGQDVELQFHGHHSYFRKGFKMLFLAKYFVTTASLVAKPGVKKDFTFAKSLVQKWCIFDTTDCKKLVEL